MEPYQQAAAGDVTTLLRVWSDGDTHAFDRLIPLVYDELHRMALRYLAGERSNMSLQADRAGQRSVSPVAGVGSGALAEPRPLLRRVGPDDAQGSGRHRATASRQSPRRPGRRSCAVGERRLRASEPDADLVAIDDALEKLAAEDARRARVVELRFFGGSVDGGDGAGARRVGPHGAQRLGVRPRLAVSRADGQERRMREGPLGAARSGYSSRRGSFRPKTRAELIARSCGTDDALRAEALSLLEADAASGEFLLKPALDRLAEDDGGGTVEPACRRTDRARTPSSSCSARAVRAKYGGRETNDSAATSPSRSCCLTSRPTRDRLRRFAEEVTGGGRAQSLEHSHRVRRRRAPRRSVPRVRMPGRARACVSVWTPDRMPLDRRSSPSRWTSRAASRPRTRVPSFTVT